MTLTIGSKIKSLRKSKGITQEQLAEILGVSFQAISKWETNIALPDITMIPALATYFGVSIDELFDFKLKELNARIMSIAREAYQHRATDPDKSRQILEAGLYEFPDNETLRCNLLYVLNCKENPNETIRIAGKLASETSDNEIKYDALRFLDYGYSAKGEAENAKAALDQIPELYFTKLSEAACLFIGKMKYEAAEKQKWISFEMLLQMMQELTKFYEAEGQPNEAVLEANRALSILDALRNERKISRFQSYADFFSTEIDRLKTIKDIARK